jgi:DNA-binding beta-propeller fold protein YncE
MNWKLAGMTSVLALAAALPALAEINFNRIATFPTTANMAEGEDTARETSAEIISVSEDGMTLVYSDSPLGVIGMVDITDPRAPKPLGNIDMSGEPTTAVFAQDMIFAGVNTSENFVSPSGKLVTVDPATRTVTAECDIGGQPDAVAKAPDGSFLAIAIENERDEDLGDGGLPQMPAGYVVKIAIVDGVADCAGQMRIDMTGLADVFPEDPEPEYVDVNAAGEIVVTMQENNHIVVIGADGAVSGHFNAGEVEVSGIDTRRNGSLDFTETKPAVPREPDAISWIDNDHFATANEGDWMGGTRTWSIFRKDGTLVWDSGNTLERAIAAMGHYPEHRSHTKGVELESIEIATFGGVPMAFAVSERGSVVGVYDLTDPANPVLKQILPSGISPEGIVAVPERNLLVTANEVDLREDGGAPAHVMVFELAEGPAVYPMITSEGSDPLIGWGALSGLAAGAAPGELYAVSDSIYVNKPAIFTIDATQTPARITAQTVITRNGSPAQKLDLEGIVADREGGFWLGSEGRTDRLFPHAIFNVDAKGEIKQEISLPPELLAHEFRFGIEGITLNDGTLWMAIQRPWKDDPEGRVKLVSYNIEDKTWGAVHYPLDKAEGDGAWVGLSEITVVGDWFYVIERDNQIADRAQVKRLYRIPAAAMTAAEPGGTLPVVTKELVRDLLPDLATTNGYVVDKVEGFAIDAAGNGWVVTDNDGVDDSSGETLFWSIGAVN